MNLRLSVLFAFGIAHALEEEDETILLQMKSSSASIKTADQNDARIPSVLDAETYDDMWLEHNGISDDDDNLANHPDGLGEAPVQGDPDEPCSMIPITIYEDKEQTKIAVPDECAMKGWALDFETTPTCEPVEEGLDWPKVCKFNTIQHDVPDEVSELLQELARPKVVAPSLMELQARVNHTYEMEKLEASGAFKKYGITKARKGKRDAQYQWAAKAYAKALLASGGCKPPTNGKKAPRGIDCDCCWSWHGPYPCNCNCRGWTQITALCFQPCTEHGSYSHDSGAYCHKPCDREEQLSNRVGCGHGHARNCFESTGECISSIVMKAWAFADVLLAIGTAGAGKAISSAAKTAKTAGVKAAMAAMKAAMRESAKKMAKNLASKSYIKKQLKSQSQSVKDNILENGANLFLTQSLPTDWGSAFLTVASIVDPTGVTGVISEFMPKDNCDESSVIDGGLPAVDNSASECGVLDDCRVADGGSSGGGSWSAQTGACQGSGAYTHCKFGQSGGWHRYEMATFSGGVSKARQYCLQDAKAWGAVGAQTALLWGWQFCFMFFPKGTSCSSVGVTGKSGYYQEWKGNHNDNLRFGGSSADYNYCMIR